MNLKSSILRRNSQISITSDNKKHYFREIFSSLGYSWVLYMLGLSLLSTTSSISARPWRVRDITLISGVSA